MNVRTPNARQWSTSTCVLSLVRVATVSGKWSFPGVKCRTLHIPTPAVALRGCSVRVVLRASSVRLRGESHCCRRLCTTVDCRFGVVWLERWVQTTRARARAWAHAELQGKFVAHESRTREAPMANDDEVLITSASFIVQRIASIALYWQQLEPHKPQPRARARARARARVVWTQLNADMRLRLPLIRVISCRVVMKSVWLSRLVTRYSEKFETHRYGDHSAPVLCIMQPCYDIFRSTLWSV